MTLSCNWFWWISSCAQKNVDESELELGVVDFCINEIISLFHFPPHSIIFLSNHSNLFFFFISFLFPLSFHLSINYSSCLPMQWSHIFIIIFKIDSEKFKENCSRPPLNFFHCIFHRNKNECKNEGEKKKKTTYLWNNLKGMIDRFNFFS